MARPRVDVAFHPAPKIMVAHGEVGAVRWPGDYHSCPKVQVSVTVWNPGHDGSKLPAQVE